jgi:HK97 family phage major capsid protein
MEQKHTLEELRGHLAEVKTEIKELAAEYDGLDFGQDATEKFEALKEERSKTEAAIKGREDRLAYLETLEGRDANRETEPKPAYSFQTRKRTNVPDNPLDLDEYRTRNNSIDDIQQAYRDGAKLVMERHFNPKHPAATKETMQDDVEKLINLDNEVALRMISTSSRGYAKEFETYVKTQGRVVGKEMERAASLTTTAGGFAVPVELDTTLMITNAGAINPIRQVARVRQTNRNTVEFINTTGITAGFAPEATEASDNTPILAQPTINLEKAFAFVPGSIEIFEDWQNIQSDLAMAFADAKARLESTKFLYGLGHSSTEPQGLIALGGATAAVTSATTAVMAIGDLYLLEQTLSPRYRPNAVIFGSKAAFNKVRAFDTAGGGALWVQLLHGQPGQLMGYPAYEWSDYSSAVTSTGSTVLTIGDPSYFAIADRVGLNVEYIQHLFATANNLPTGQRGLYAYWRTSSKLLTPSLSANSAFQSLKLL